MKSFLAIAAIAAVTFADEEAVADATSAAEKMEDSSEGRSYSNFERELEHAYEDFERALEDLVRQADRNPTELAEEAFKEGQREVEREVEKAIEDMECAKADMPGGDGTCPKRERRAAEDACWQSMEEPNYWDWDAQECITWEENEKRREQRCKDDGGDWIALRDGWGKECYTGNDPWQDCMLEGPDMEWEWQSQTCMLNVDACALQNDGNTEWKTEEWGSWCEWKMLKKLGAQKSRAVSKILSKRPDMQKTLADISISLDFGNLEDIYTPVKDGHLDGAAMLDEMLADWGPDLEAWAEGQKQREENAWCALINEMGSSVDVNTVQLDQTEGWRGCDSGMALVLKKNLRKSKNVRKAVSMMAVSDGMDINFTTPTEAELDEMRQRIEGELETIQTILGNLEEEFAPQYEKLDNELAQAVDEQLGGEIKDFVGGVMNDWQPYVDSWNVEPWAEDATAVLLAKKQAAAAASSKKSNAGFYTGLSFGFLGVVASAAMIAACNKKKTQECEETLL